MGSSISGIGGMTSPHLVSGASSYSSPNAKMGNLFQAIDSGNTGSISLQQFQQAFATKNPPASFQSLGANATFNQLDPQGTGSVSKADFVSGMTGLMRSLRQAGSGSATAVATTSAANGTASIRQSLQSFLQLGSQASTESSGPGAILDVQI